MNRISRWKLGLLPLLALWVGAVFFSTGPIETRIAQQVAASLDLPERSVIAHGRDVRLAGLASSEDERRRAVAAAESASGARKVDAAVSVIPVQSPFAFAAQREGDRLVLSGFVPSEKARGEVVSAGKSAGLQVHDNLVRAQGAPDRFEALASAAMAALGRMSDGRVDLSDKVLTIKGTPSGGTTIESILSALASAGLTPRENGLAYRRVEPFVFTAAKSPDGVVALSGAAPSAKAREDALAAARTAGSSVTGELSLASGFPAGSDFDATAYYALRILALLGQGRADLQAGTLAISGTPGSDPAALAAVLAAAPRGVTVSAGDLRRTLTEEASRRSAAAEAAQKRRDDALMAERAEQAERARQADVARQAELAQQADLARQAELDRRKADDEARASAARTAAEAAERKAEENAKSAAAEAGARENAENARAVAAAPLTASQPATSTGPCLDAVRQAVARPLLFATRSIRLGDAANATVAAIAARAKNCPDAALVVDGHADWVGGGRGNMLLSWRRTRVVVRALQAAGVPAAQIAAAAFGETHPAEDNRTRDGRSHNRRVIVSVK